MKTKEERAAIAERTEKATLGPWKETWRQAVGFPDYEVSDFGNVRTLLRKGNHTVKKCDAFRLLKLATNRGYKSVSLPVNGSYRHKPVHRLVAAAFLGDCPEGFEVAHLNGDPSDNRVSNLRYCSHKENESHKIVHGTRGFGELNPMAKLQGWQVAEIKYLGTESIPQGSIARLFDIDHKCVSEILSGDAWAQEPAREDVPALLADIEERESECGRLLTHACERDNEVGAAEARAVDAEAREARLREALGEARARLNRDKTGLGAALDRIRKEVAGRTWISDGRGPYAWDAERYKAEAGDALRAVDVIAYNALSQSGDVADAGVRAIDTALAATPPTGPSEVKALRAENVKLCEALDEGTLLLDDAQSSGWIEDAIDDGEWASVEPWRDRAAEYVTKCVANFGLDAALAATPTETEPREKSE